MVESLRLNCSCIFALTILLAACSSKPLANDVEWPAFNQTLSSERFAHAENIDPKSVARLSPICELQFGKKSTLETGLIMVNRTIYLTVGATTYAVNATNCELRWKHLYVPRGKTNYTANRGVAVSQDSVFRGTADGYVLSLDAKNGKERWRSKIADSSEGAFVSAAPIVWKGVVIIGPSGGDRGISGSVFGLDAITGKVIWKFNTLAQGEDPGAKSWANPLTATHGGGAAWTSYSLDEANSELFIPVGNPSPDFAPLARPGLNLYTSSLVVLDALSGKLKWYYQARGQGFDYGLSASPVLYGMEGNKRVAFGSKDGYLYSVERSSHHLDFLVPVTTIKNRNVKLGKRSIQICPGTVGGVMWNGPAYSPQTKTLFVGSVDWCANAKTGRAEYKFGLGFDSGKYVSNIGRSPTGWLTSVDASTGIVKWKYHAETPILAAVTPTDGGLVFSGDLNGNLLGFRSESGQLVYQKNLGRGALAGGIITYKIEDEQYLAVAAGHHSTKNFYSNGEPSLVILGLINKNQTKKIITLAAPTAVQQTTSQKEASVASGKKFVISSQGVEASRAAAEILHKGGNLVDAMVAASLVIAVERPHASGLGGGGFLLYREAKTGKIYAIDFRARAPLAATEKMFLDKNGNVIKNLAYDGILAVAVPGLVAGLSEIHARFGRLPFAQLAGPAIRLARSGITVYPHLFKALTVRKSILAKYPASAKIFLKPSGEPYGLGERIVQNDLAKSLTLIAKTGAKAFYRGALADALVAESERLGGLITSKDLIKYKVKWRSPVSTDFRGFQVYSMPPPSSGGTHVIEILNTLERDPLASYGVLTSREIHLTASAMQLAFADRAEYMADSDFKIVPVKGLISKSYGKLQRQRINDEIHIPSDQIKAGIPNANEPSDTTQLSMIDAEGNMISTTQTIYGFFGSGVVVPGTGIVLNNTMDGLTAKVGSPNFFGAIGSAANIIEPYKAPLSSMAPTLVVRDGVPVLSIGGIGGTRIITCVAQTILNYLALDLPLYDSVATVRFHHQWKPDVLEFDAPGPSLQVVQALREMKYKVEIDPGLIGCRVMAAARENERLIGTSDPRDIGISIAE